LRRRLEYVQSDEYVEKWAREDAHMIQPGDHPVFLVTPRPEIGATQVAPRPEAVIEDTTLPNWHAWWKLFFDTEPRVLDLE